MNISPEIYGATDKGRIRTRNEDKFIAEPLWDDNHFLCVAIDGVGGHEGGEIAAELAQKKIREYLVNNFNGEESRLLREAVNDANNAIYNERLIQPELSNMSCVLTACIIDTEKGIISWSHVGDTRLYVFEKGVLVKLSHDHSLVGYREEIGDLTEEEAMNHPQRNIINRDVGSALHRPDDEDFIESGEYEVTDKAIALLCSDGLCDMLTSRQITSIIKGAKSLKYKCLALIEEANKSGGKDNITVVMANITQKTKKKNTDSVSKSAKTEHAADSHSADNEIEYNKEPLRRKAYSKYKYLIVLLIIALIGFLARELYKKYQHKTEPGKEEEVNGSDAVISNDTLNIHFMLNKAQSDVATPFSYTTANGDSIVKIKMPIIIYANSFKWIQNKKLYIEPADSLKVAVGLIVSGNGCILQNIVFRNFTKDSIRVYKER